MTKRVSGFHTAKCARGGRPQARLSLIENHDHNLNNDKRQLAKNEPLDSVKSRPGHSNLSLTMIKQATILLTLCATSLVVINIRTLESETLPDARPALLDTCLVARWAGYPAAFSSSWDLSAGSLLYSGRYRKEQEIAVLGVARLLSRYNLSATFYHGLHFPKQGPKSGI